jgi:hypothetical protein
VSVISVDNGLLSEHLQISRAVQLTDTDQQMALAIREILGRLLGSTF